MSRWLQKRAPRVTSRLPTETQSFLASVKKAMQKLKFRVEEGLEDKFELMSMNKIEVVDSLKTVYNLAIRIEEFANALRSYDMMDIFTIPNDFTYNSTEDIFEPSTGATPIDLI